MVPALVQPAARAAPSRRAAPRADDTCRGECPPYEEKRPGHWAACWHSDQWLEPADATASDVRRGPVLEVTGSRSTSRCARACCAAPSATSMPSTASASPSARARRWGWSARAGCGKTTVGRTILRLIEPTAGTIKLDGPATSRRLGKKELRPYRRQMQIIFQDPFSSLNPRMRAGDIVGEPLKVHGIGGAQGAARAGGRAVRAGRPAARRRWTTIPHQFSGGQRQRIGVARALALKPKLIVGDEPVSALDVSIQAQVINLLMDLQREHEARLPLHLAQPGGGRAHQPPHRRHVSRPHRRAHRQRHAVHATRCIPTPRRCWRPCRCPTRRSSAQAGGAGRRAEPAQPAARLPLPHPLPLRRGPLQGRGAGAARNRARPSRFLPSALAPLCV